MRARARDIRTVQAPPGSEVAVVQAFVRAEARSPQTARSLEALGLRLTPVVEQLQARGLLARAGAEAWFLDGPGYRARRRRSHARVLAATAIVLGALAWLVVRVAAS